MTLQREYSLSANAIFRRVSGVLDPTPTVAQARRPMDEPALREEEKEVVEGRRTAAAERFTAVLEEAAARARLDDLDDYRLVDYTDYNLHDSDDL